MRFVHLHAGLSVSYRVEMVNLNSESAEFKLPKENLVEKSSKGGGGGVIDGFESMTMAASSFY